MVATKKFFLILSAVLVAGMVSCGKDPVSPSGNDNDNEPPRPETGSVITAGYDATRVSVGMEERDGVDVFEMLWAEGDAISVFYGPKSASDPDTYAHKVEEDFVIYHGVGEKIGKFAGGQLPTTHEEGRVFYAVHPVDVCDKIDLYEHQVSVDLPQVQTQTGRQDKLGLGTYMKMWADPIEDTGELDLENLDFKFSQLMALLEFRLKNIPSGKSIVGVTVQGGLQDAEDVRSAPFMKRMNFDRRSSKAGFVYASINDVQYYVNSMAVVMDAPIGGEDFSAYLAVIPRDCMTNGFDRINGALGSSSSRDLDVVVTVTDDATHIQSTYTFERRGKQTCFEAAKCYPVELDFYGKSADAGSALPVGINGNVITVFDLAGLQWVRDVTNYGDNVGALSNNVNYNGFSGYTVKLTGNIDLGCNVSNPWTPIGSSSATPFRGSFDGLGKVISGLVINAFGAVASDGRGLFGNVIGTSGSKAGIANVILNAPSVQANGNDGCLLGVGKYADINNCKVVGGSISGNGGSPVGALVASLSGESSSIGSCSVEGVVIDAGSYNNVAGILGATGALANTEKVIVSGCNVINTTLTGSDPSNGCNGLGFVVGQVASPIALSNCVVSGTSTLTSSGKTSGNNLTNGDGGIVGVINNNGGGSTISGCTVESTVVLSLTTNAYALGGIVGFVGNVSAPEPLQPVRISDCTNKATLTTANVNVSKINFGGIVGLNRAPQLVISGCTNMGSIAPLDKGTQGNIGGICGTAEGGLIILGCRNTGNVDCTPAGNNFSAGGICGTNTSGYVAGCYNTANVTGNSPETIANSGFGGIVGYQAEDGVTVGCYTTGTVSGSTSVTAAIGGKNLGGVSYCYHASGADTGVKGSGTVANCGVFGQDNFPDSGQPGWGASILANWPSYYIWSCPWENLGQWNGGSPVYPGF